MKNTMRNYQDNEHKEEEEKHGTTNISERASNMAMPSDRSASSLISIDTVMKQPKKSNMALARDSSIPLMVVWCCWGEGEGMTGGVLFVCCLLW